MNGLSWFLYLASVVESFNTFIIIVGFMFVLLWLARFFWIMCEDEQGKINLDDLAAHMGNMKYIWGFIICLLLAVVTPNSKTIYLIAGSEVGGTVVTSDEGKEILNDIRLIIKQQVTKE